MKKPHGNTGKRAPKSFTPEQLEETRRQMLAVSYDDIKREFEQACAESKAKPGKRRLQ